MAVKSKIPASWINWSDDKLLNLRLKDLPISINHPKIQFFIQKIEKELESKNIRFRPYYWLSDEFFTPDGIAGIAVPFYLAHPRLKKLEKKQMFEVEGSNKIQGLRIFRHEVGHAIEHAFFLHRKRKRIKTFGASSAPYPDTYVPKPFSRSYVINLTNGYAQSHPDEDFAETFAVWLNPHSRWKQKYKKWPALKKLQCVDSLMNDIQNLTPVIKGKKRPDHFKQISKTLRELYDEKKERFGITSDFQFYDRDLLKLFSSKPEFDKNISASRFIRGIRREARKKVAFWTGQYRYTIDEVIENILDRCQHLQLRLQKTPESSKEDFFILLTVITKNYLSDGGHGIPL